MPERNSRNTLNKIDCAITDGYANIYSGKINDINVTKIQNSNTYTDFGVYCPTSMFAQNGDAATALY